MGLLLFLVGFGFIIFKFLGWIVFLILGVVIFVVFFILLEFVRRIVRRMVVIVFRGE